MSNNYSIQGGVEFNQSGTVAARVTLWEAGNEKPLSSMDVGGANDPQFCFEGEVQADEPVFYIIARLQDCDVSLLLVLPFGFEQSVVVNELTTVASAFTCAQFFSGTYLSGNAQALSIASANTKNLVNPETGSWGEVVINPFNITQNETLARLNTLASLISAYGGGSVDLDWKNSFFEKSTPQGGVTPTNTAEAMIGIALSPWSSPGDLFSLFDQAYPLPVDGFPANPLSKVSASRRSAPFVPYLSFAPEDFAMILAFGEGGICAPGKLSLDGEGNLWTGLNWMAGAQNGVYQGIGGGLVKLSSSGELISPPVTGYTGMGLDGAGWGTAVTSKGFCWVTSFNSAIGVYNLTDGAPIQDTPVVSGKEMHQLGGLQGLGEGPNGDIWVTGTSSNKLICFPDGDVNNRVEIDNETLNKELSAPFAVVVDSSNRAWISNTNSTILVRYSSDNGVELVEKFSIAGGGRGVALDSAGNCWVACNTSEGFPSTKPTDGVSIIEGFALGYPHLDQTLGQNNKTGSVYMIAADASPSEKGSDSSLVSYGDGEINVPWGISVDGNDDVWVANFMGKGISFMAGSSPSGRTADCNTGDVVHTIHSGSIQMLTDVVVDQAGNLWCANNWNVPETVMQGKPEPSVSTWGGGSGVVVVYGVARPAQTPLVGAVQPLSN